MNSPATAKPMATNRRWLLLVPAIIIVFWSYTRWVPSHIESRVAASAAHHGFVLRSDSWSISWGTAILAANDVTLAAADGSITIDAPRVEVDFHVLKLLGGWDQAVYQVYVHRPTLRADGRISALACVLSPTAPGRFAVERLYADVVSMRWRDALVDNGVLTLRQASFAPGGQIATSNVEFHGRMNGGKSTLLWDGETLRVATRGIAGQADEETVLSQNCN